MNTLKKFQELLREIFQFESSDLDFGIYRILNYKQKEVEKFINQKLPQIIEDAFQKHKRNLSEDTHEEYERAKREIIRTLGNNAFTTTGELNPLYADTPLGQEYLRIKEQKELLEKLQEIKEQVYNDLYSFFSRFYEDGDFIPQYRYSKEPKYSIPYNGEEVKLYWANADQYYIKTGILFRDYTFRAGDKKVIFRTVSAREEINSNKATKQRYFVLDEDPIQTEQDSIIIRFQYRELGEEEIKLYKDNANGQEIEQEEENGGRGRGVKQEKINEKIFEKLKKDLEELFYKRSDLQHAINRLFEEQRNQQPLLLYHINRFTAKNTRDYFIHKDIKKFLMGQLDYFIKSEVLNYETLSEEKYLDKHITRAKVVKEVGEKIIDFLAQIEDFQKKLWEKKKFVIQTHYVITLDKIKEWAGEEFYREVLKEVLRNSKQLEEWERLGFGKFESEWDLVGKKLPIDTRYFDERFKWELLERISERVNLDDALDGLLIKSENWQALNTILNKYKESIKTIYIDPPYNTGNDEFLYRDRYQHSSWLTMMENRLSLAKDLLQNEGVIFISIGDTLRSQVRINSSSRLQIVCNQIFNEDNFIATFVRKSGTAPRQDIKHIANSHDYVFCYAKNIDCAKINRKLADISRLKHEDEHIDYRGKFDLNQLDRGSKQYSESLDYPIIIERGEIIRVFDGQTFKKLPAPEKIEIWPGGDPNDKRWIFTWSKEKVKWGIENDFIVFRKDRNGKWKAYYKEYELVDNLGKPRERTNPYDTLILEFPNELGTSEIESLFSKRVFEYPKPSDLIKHLLKIGSCRDSLIFDFFAGSGTTAHAVMKLNKEDGGNRKFILVEIADYFETIILPRIKKVAYSFNWENGNPEDTDGLGVFFKYQILEQYEDALDNIKLKENKLAQNLFKDEYLIKYFLEFETRNSPYLLNIEKLKNPFAYKLKVNLSEVGEPKEMIVDIPETFNYLLGLKVKKIKKRKDNGKTYLFVLGEKDGRDYAIVWREYSDQWKEEDFKKDKEFIKQELQEWKPQVVYVNGQSILTPNFGDFQVELHNIEPEFKRLMEG